MDNNQHSDNKKFVEDYYRDILNEEQKKQFEENINNDPAFAEEVAFYLSTIIAAKELQQEEAIERFKELYKQRPATGKVVRLKKWNVYAASAAAALIIVIGSYFIFFQTTPKRLADNYAKEHLMELRQTMGAADSLQQGIALYNRQQYDSAIKIFEGIYINHPDNSEAKMNIGLAYLAKKNYDEALQQFDELGNMKGLYASHALFLKAITLMQRNKTDDKEETKQLLEQVVQQKLYGNKEAEEWVEKF